MSIADAPESASFHRLFELSLDLLCIASLDGYFTRVNPAFERVLGHAAIDLLTRPFIDLVHPDDRAATLTELDRLGQGLATIGFENRYRCADGSYRWLAWTAMPRPDENRIYAVARDVTALKEVERCRRASETRLQALLEHAAEVVGLIDADTTFSYVSPSIERLLGYPAVDFLGRRALDLVHADDYAGALDALRRTIATPGVAVTAEMRLRHRDGRWIWIEATGTSRLDDPSVGAIVFNLSDATERRRAEQQAELLAQHEKLRALGQLAGGIAHDLNQSLGMVAGYAELARQALEPAVPDTAGAREMLAVVAQAALDGGESVRRLLAFARPTRAAEPETIDLRDLLDDVARLTVPRWRNTAQAEGRTIRLAVDAEAGTVVTGYPAILRQAITNLVLNAIDALPVGGTIRLHARALDEQVEIEVADTGTGMSPEVQARAFEPFFTTKGAKGTGLGLAQVYGAVELHHGSVEVSSDHGHGTRFTLRLPGHTSAAEPAESAVPPGSHAMHILVVDDEPRIGRMASLMLRQAGHRVVTAVTAEDAIELLATRQFDVVVTDLGLGTELNGWDVARAVKERVPATRVVLATGWGAEIDPSEARRRGVDAVLAKPYQTATLLGVLAS